MVYICNFCCDYRHLKRCFHLSNPVIFIQTRHQGKLLDDQIVLLKYLAQYRKATVEESGQPGNLYYAWTVSIGLFLLSAIALIVLIFSK